MERIKLELATSDVTVYIDWNQLKEGHEIAYLRTDICLRSTQSYNLEERQICADMEAATAEIDAALRNDFQQMLDFLQKSNPEHFDWWAEALLGKIPDSLGEIV